MLPTADQKSSLTISTFSGGAMAKILPASAGDAGLVPGLGRFPEKEIASCSCILAWKVPWTEESSGLLPMELQSWTRLSTHTHTHTHTHTDTHTHNHDNTWDAIPSQDSSTSSLIFQNKHPIRIKRFICLLFKIVWLSYVSL